MHSHKCHVAVGMRCHVQWCTTAWHVACLSLKVATKNQAVFVHFAATWNVCEGFTFSVWNRVLQVLGTMMDGIM
jgi:hypothetical protein